jgi:hypothetical protein
MCSSLTSQYRNCGTISDVTSFWWVFYWCELWHWPDIGRFSVKKTFWYIFDIWSSHVNLLFIINRKFFTFWWKSMELSSNKIWHASPNCKSLGLTTMTWDLVALIEKPFCDDQQGRGWRTAADVKLYVVCIQVISTWYNNAHSRVILWGIGQNWTRVHQNPWDLAIWFIIQYHKTRIFLFWPKKSFCRFYEFLKNFGLAQKKIVKSRYWLQIMLFSTDSHD